MTTKDTHMDPFSRLAPEILAEIFFQCLPLEPTGSLQKAPLLLLQVCRRWYDVAFNTPNLWQNISIGHRCKDIDPVETFDTFLQNSGSLPLRITFRLASVRLQDLTHEENEILINAVLDNIHRVQVLRGYLPRSFPSIILKRLSTSGADRHVHAPLLHLIDITGFEFPSEVHQVFMTHASNYIIAPNLQELHLTRSRSFLSIVSFSPPPSNSLQALQSLYIAEFMQNIDMSFLSHIPNLTTFDLRIHDGYRHFIRIHPPIYLPGLRDIRLALLTNQYPEILQSFYAPNIEKLTLNVIAPHFTQFIQLLTKGSNPPLRFLHLRNLYQLTHLTSVLECLLRFTQIEEIIFTPFPTGSSGCHATTQLLSIRKEGYDEIVHELFPELTSITIQRTHFNDVDLKPLLELLKNRSTSKGGKLSYIKFLHCQFSNNIPGNVRISQSETDNQLKMESLELEDWRFADSDL